VTTSDVQTRNPEDERGSFRADVSPRGIGNAFTDYFVRLRGGDPGALPSVLGLLVLGLIFATTTDKFISHDNAANLAAQSSFIALIALGLVFVLLVGEIDLSAGTTAGMTAAFAAQGLKSGDLHHAVGNYVYWGLVAGMAGAIVLGVVFLMIVAPAMVAVGLLIMLIGANEDHQWLAFYFAVSIGVAVGTFSGTLVARLGIPSFIVTLALLLAWEGVELYALKNQSVGTTNFDDWYKLTHGEMTVTQGWIFYGVAAGGYLVFTFVRSRMRRANGLSADTVALVLVRAGVVLAIGAFITNYLNQNRSPNDIVTIEGVPWAASVPIAFMIFWTLWLAKTHWGRALYAIGGNIGAARLTGMPVRRHLVTVYAVSGVLAAFAGLVVIARVNAADSGTGEELLLTAIAAVCLGGTSLFGGVGGIAGGAIGSLILALVVNGMNMLSIATFWQAFAMGVIVLFAVFADVTFKRRMQ